MLHADHKNQSLKNQHVVIIGAGPAGITAGYVLSKLGSDIEIFEAADTVGGMSRSLDLWGQIVDLGPHRFFSTDRRVNQLWLEIVGNHYEMVKRLTRIYYKSRFFYYPLKPINALVNLGAFEAFLCVFSYLRHRLFPNNDESTFDAWVKNRFGGRLYRIFFKTYSEKLWGISCDALNSDFARQRIKKLSLWEIAKNFLSVTNTIHKTLVDEFAYPRMGTGSVYQKMAEKAGRIRLTEPVHGVEIVDDKIRVRLKSNEIITCDHVISTMPLTDLIIRLNIATSDVIEAVEKLKYRNTIIVYLKIENENLFPDQWLYIHSKELKTGRITNFRNWVPSIHGNEKSSVLALEYWCDTGDEIWQAKDDQVIDLAMEDMKKLNFFEPDEVSDVFVYRISKSYPVYDKHYKRNLEIVKQFLIKIEKLTVIGRYGAFKYNNQDHSILMGLLAAENVYFGTQHDLWSINTDYEYQESTVITKTGLQKNEIH